MKKKLIEVALPLEAINKEGSHRKRKAPAGYPTTLHKWWAQRPVAAARAVLFAQMVDDPSAYVEVLRADPKLRRRAEIALKARLRLWEEARALAKKASGSGLPVPEQGPAPTLDEVLADQERQRLFRIIEDLVLWENTANETVLQAARDEIWQSWRRTCAENAGHPQAKELFDRKKLPAFQDPFAGSGAIPMEAQRLGLESYASDLNPVAVLINKAMIEIPPRFAGRPPVNPKARAEIKRSGGWHGKGAQGLAEDVRFYGQWIREEAEKRIGYLFPDVNVTTGIARGRPDLKPYVGRSLPIIAWLWVRTVKSPNPAFASVDVPLASTFMLSTKAGREAYVEPVKENGDYRFTVEMGKPKNESAKKGTKLARGANFSCLMSGTPIAGDYIKAEGKAGRIGARLMAVVAEGDRGRVYLAPTREMEDVARQANPEWKPIESLPLEDTANFWCSLYGLTTYGDLFTPRQLVTLTTFCKLVQEVRERVERDALAASCSDDRKPLREGGAGGTAYAEALEVYLSMVMTRVLHYGSTICLWLTKDAAIARTFTKQAIPMTWDFAEGNVFGKSSAEWTKCTAVIASAIEYLPANQSGTAVMADATTAGRGAGPRDVISTDPPYYDNIGYADLSDYFYVWLRRSLRPVFPELFATLVVPKAEELVATPYRHGGKEEAESFFLTGMTRAMHRLSEHTHPAFPVTIYYAFKQSETDGADGTTNTGWDTFLAAVIEAGLAISGTWPMRTESDNRQIGIGANALASSIVLVCRPRPTDAPSASRREFVAALKAELPSALAHLQRGNIAPVDLAQAAIGPGMAVYTRYSVVLDAEGKPLSVREALALINQILDEALAEQEGDFDADSRWALTWFEHSGFDEGEYGVAETLATARNTSVSGLVEAGVVLSRRGKVRLLRPEELPADWNPTIDPRLTAWEIVHQLIRVLAIGGESAAAELVANLGAKAEVARELAYRLYALCERKKRAGEALAYNGLVQSWPEITRLAREVGKPKTEQGGLFGETEE